MLAITLTAATFVVFLVFSVASFFVESSGWQSFLAGSGSAFLSVSIGLVVVNLLLNSADKKNAAKVVMMMLIKIAKQYNQDLFYNLGAKKIWVSSI